MWTSPRPTLALRPSGSASCRCSPRGPSSAILRASTLGDNAQKAVAAAKPARKHRLHGAWARRRSSRSRGESLRRWRRNRITPLPPRLWKCRRAEPPRAEPSPPAAQLQALPPVVPAKPTHKHEHRDNAKKQPRVDTTAALPSSAPASPEQPVAALAEPSEPPATVAPGPAAFKPNKKVKRDQAKAAPGYQLASLGSPGLKAALAPENASPRAALARTKGPSRRHRPTVRSAIPDAR